MPIADQFDPRSDAGFVRSYDLRSARRQFQVSLLLIVVMAGAALALGLVTRFELSLNAQPAALQKAAPGPAQT